MGGEGECKPRSMASPRTPCQLHESCLDLAEMPMQPLPAKLPDGVWRVDDLESGIAVAR
jgi:hypothetical protein